MKILIAGAGKMGSFFCDLLSFKHDVAVYDPDPERLRFTFNTRRFASLDEVDGNAYQCSHRQIYDRSLPYAPAAPAGRMHP